tara:strand:- start:4 stop:297 length:294 start_codon:yes stop_codon:yes gene_type:complete
MFKLAGHLKMTVGELKSRITWRELVEWIALDLFISPLPNSWLEAGTVASAVLAPHMKKGTPPPAPEEFMPKQKIKQSEDEMMRELMKLKALTEHRDG